MGDASATPEKLLEDSRRTVPATSELADWIRRVLTRCVVDYQVAAIDYGNDIAGLTGGHRDSDTIGISALAVLADIDATDRRVKEIGDAFARAGGYSTLNAPGSQPVTAVHTTDAALETQSPEAIARRLLAGPGGLHPINVSPALLEGVREASERTGVSERLLLAILWQEQQWYQNDEPGLSGPETEIGRIYDLLAQQARQLVQGKDKSLGITHVKLATARRIINGDRSMFTIDGRFLGGMSDVDLEAYIEANPEMDIFLTASYLRQLGDNPYGAASDKQLFMLYAWEDPRRRDANFKYQDRTPSVQGDYRSRAQNWDRLQQHLDDAAAWASLTDAERRETLDRLAKESGQGQPPILKPLFTPPGVITSLQSGGPRNP